ncbi:MAG: Crp/Fnr family transcriptional regulator [Acidobacteriaceae bacterium]|nr:Crp/Fnr family transcriptional regulator [Acidobacteriaceae bacterium]MBV9038787.1 Crp/Fnr family transcriptional regulator [Acidobacteriaceae bacterium]MBV9222658.1 Crp/Fnr family transcriptional regulator [Acidobacteriaceae bacterium]MBV9675319.1 Crp/Fnr family transcriptional regulator [Acidobacteriaceae bacterium]MBV9939328.1 Crp/Fnr family transcriptional regulator [Acidobacteriaceae bacterium]
MTSLAPEVQNSLLQSPEVTHLRDLRRSTVLFLQNQPADSLFLLEEGLVKMTRMNEAGSRIILSIRGPGDLLGEEVLAEPPQGFYTEAEVLTNATVAQIPRETLRQAFAESDLALSLVNYILQRRNALAVKIELLCLNDVEHRVLHYLAELSSLVKPGEGVYQIPITQLELADLVGATRETTSTTLNQLERRGLIKLSRRMLIVPSPEKLQAVARERVKLDGDVRKLPEDLLSSNGNEQ